MNPIPAPANQPPELQPETPVEARRGQAPLSIRLRLGGAARIGPGKVALLEAIARTGHLNDAAQAMGMSARRAGLLVDSLNQVFDPPLVVQTDGTGSRMQLSPLGLALIDAYRSVEQTTADAVAQRFGCIEARLKPATSDSAALDPTHSDPSDMGP